MPPYPIPHLRQTPSQPFDAVESMPRMVASTTANALVANQAYLCKVRFPRSLFITGIKIGVATASGNVDVGLYNSPDGGTTLNRLASSGSVAIAGVNAIQSVSFTAGVSVIPGQDYWLAMAPDNAVATLIRNAVNSFIMFDDFRCALKATSFPLPAQITGHGALGILPWMSTVGS